MTSINNIIDFGKPRRSSYQYERADIQKKSFAKWVNYILKKGKVKIWVKDIIDDLQDGTILLALIEVLTGRHLSQEKGNMRVHHINNINKVLKVLQVYDTKLVNIRSEEIVDGKQNSILGLIWSLILNFQIKAAIHQMMNVGNDMNNNELEKNLLKWCNDVTQRYSNINIKNFTTSWRDGLAFNAILHHFRGDLFDFQELVSRTANSNLRHAFDFAHSQFRITPLLDPEDVNTDKPDKKSIMMYITTMYEVLTSLKEVNTESEGSEQELQGARSDSPTPSSVSTMSEWDDYNETLSQVLTWLLQAETQLNQQEDVSDNVDKVKDQFREHEEFMMILTSHQASVGSVLEFGSQLINEGIVSGREEKDIREQMALLSDRWENLRVSAMQRQSVLHQHLMKLQQSQLKDLSDWLANAEKIMSTTPSIASDIETVRKQVEEHKQFQEDLENQQQHVNSLSHMVVVVDESESENATADLEEQLAVLGDRWSAVCKWTESRWVSLQEILSNWQQYRSEEQRLDSWLRDEEESLRAISVIDMGDKDEVQKQLQKLKSLEQELTEQQSSFGEFNLAAQRVAQSLEEDSPAIQGILDTMEDFNRRWNTIASMLNTKMKHFCGMENKLQSFLKEIEDNMSWISDTETLLNPQASPQRDLIESLDQAIKKRRTSIASLSRQGEELIQQTLSAGQSIVGIKQYLTNFREKWDALIETMDQRKQTLEMMEKKKALTDESQRILTVVVEIITYIEKITLELKHDPKELLMKIEVKIKELESCRTSFDKLSTEIMKQVSDPALKSVLEAELKTLQDKLQVAGSLLTDKQKSTALLIESTPPPEFLEKMSAVRNSIDAIFPSVNCDFKYNTVTKMQAALETLKTKSNNLNDQETFLKLLSKQQKEMLKDLSPESYKRYQEQLNELSKHWVTSKKMTESRLQRLREAILQTNELETALKETFSWMNDVDKFLEEITGTVAEGDAETIESQVLEVEALQQDIDLVQKKVDSLIETCTQIIKRSEEDYSKQLEERLNDLHKRWAAIKTSTEKQKESLRNAGLKFKEVDSGVRDIVKYLLEVEASSDPTKLEGLDRMGLINKIEYFQEVETQLSLKAGIIKQFQETVNQIMTNIPAGGLPPPVFQDLKSADEKYQKLTVIIKELLKKISSYNSELEKYDALTNKVKASMAQVDETIGNSSQKLDVDDEELESCFNLLKKLVLQISNEELREVEKATNSLLEYKISSNVAQSTLQELKTRWDVTLERSKKVQFILEGELMRREQLKKDLVQLKEWLSKSLEQINERLNGNIEVEDQYIDLLAEEISLNESLKISLERSARKESQEKIKAIQNDWNRLMTSFEQLKSVPKMKELERKFSLLEGSILTDIDNLKRKAKKILLNSPVVQDIQISVENLEDITKACVGIDEQIKEMQELSDSITSKGKAGSLAKHIQEVNEEYEKLKSLISSKEKIFADALPLAEAVFANLDMVSTWLDSITADVDNIVIEPLPNTPEQWIDKTQSLIKVASDKASDIQLLHSNAISLCRLSDEKSFKDLESDVRQIFNSYSDINNNAKNKLDILKSWARDLDEYERKVDDLNAWIDGRLSTLDSIGGVSNKFDVETELQKVKSIRSLFEAKEGELKILKLCADDITRKGNPSIVEPFEKQIKERWTQLDKKINGIYDMLSKKIEDIEKEEKLASMKIISEEEMIIDEPIQIKELNTAPDLDSIDSGNMSLLDEVESALPERLHFQTKPAPQPTSKVSIKISSLSNQKKSKVEVKSRSNAKLEDRCYQVDNELNRINTMLNDLKLNNNDTDFDERNSIFHNIEDEVTNLHTEYEELLRNFELVKDVSNPELTNLVDKFNRTLIIFIETKIKTMSEVFNYHQMRHDLVDIEKWIEQTEKVLNVSKEPQKIKVIEETFEKYSALIESVNLRAEKLLAVSSEKYISKMQFNLLNKRFKIISKHFERYQSPEEKMTTYKVSVFTGNNENGDTRANVYIKLFGEYGNSDQLQLRQSETKRKKFQVGQVDLFSFRDHPWLGKLSKLRIWHDNTGFSPEWFVASVYIHDELSGKLYAFALNTWISKDSGSVSKEFPFSAMTLTEETSSDILLRPHQYSNVFWVFSTVSIGPHTQQYDTIQEFLDAIDSLGQEVSNLTNELYTWNQIELPFDQFDKQKEIHQLIETTCKSIALRLQHLLKAKNNFKMAQNENIHKINNKLASLCAQWNTINQEWRSKSSVFAESNKTWETFQTEYNNLSFFLEQLKSLGKEDMREALLEQESNYNLVKNLGEKISQKSSKLYAQPIQEKLSLIDMQWSKAQKEIHVTSELPDTMEMEQVMMEIMNLNDYHRAVMVTKPHPVDEDELENFLKKLKTIERELPAMGEAINDLHIDAAKLLKQSNISTARQDEISSHVADTERKYREIKNNIGSRLDSVRAKLERATKFLEELEELSVWMSATRDLLEGQQQGKPGVSIDPETMKMTLETRKSNVESINRLLTQFKDEGELTSGRFPLDVGEKIARLNVDWQVIIRLAIALKDHQPTAIVEEQVMSSDIHLTNTAPPLNEMLTTSEDIKVNISFNDYSSTGSFESKIAQLNDFLKLVDNKLKGLDFAVGDDDDMEAALQKQTTIQNELDSHRSELEDAIEIGAAINMNSNDQSQSYAVDDKVTKVKEHWEIVNGKVSNVRSNIENLMVDTRRFNELRQQMENFIYKSQIYLKDTEKIGSTVTELEEQLDKHKRFQDDLSMWFGAYNDLMQLGSQLRQKHAQFNFTTMQTKLENIKQSWDGLQDRSHARQKTLQEALDRLLLFHKNMISALTWLSSAESKVAELDSLVDANQTEESTANIKELQREMKELEKDIAAQEPVFMSLNQAGNQIIVDLEAGEVRTALQSKLDDMNDRWNSLGVRVVDIRERMSSGTGEWRQLLLDMQEIVDWLARADQELRSHQPIGTDIVTIRRQNSDYQEFKSKLTVRHVVIEQALQQGHEFLKKHQAGGSASTGDTNTTRAAHNLQNQLTNVEANWQDLIKGAEKWSLSLTTVLQLFDELNAIMDLLNTRLNDADNIRSKWIPVTDVTPNNVSDNLHEAKNLHEQLLSLEPRFEKAQSSMKELKHIHNVTMGNSFQESLDNLNDRWKQLLSDSDLRLSYLDGQQGGDTDTKTANLLPGSVSPPWERGAAANKVPYFINHETKTTQWDHPKITELYNTLAELNSVKFAAYRTSMKLRCIQQACCLDLVDLSHLVTKVFINQLGIQSGNDELIDVGEIINILMGVFQHIEKSRKADISVAQCVDLTLNWLLNVYDSGRIGKIRVLSFKVAIVLLSRAKLEDKWKYLFQQIADPMGHVDSKKLGLLLHDCVQIPRQLGEIASFGGSNIEPSVRSCFEKSKNPGKIDVNNFLAWTHAEPQSIVWMAVLHRLAAAETAKHEAKCNICKKYPIVGFRYRCLKCFNYDLCQGCFWSGRVSKSHRITHPMHQYSLQTTTGEDMSDFVKLMKNKFKSRRYRKPSSKKLGYLPVQTIMEGSNIETPSIPILTADMSSSFDGMDGNSTFEYSRYTLDDVAEEHRLIQQMCRTLNGVNNNNSQNSLPLSPSQILDSLAIEQKQDIRQLIEGLEEENLELNAEKNRLLGIKSSKYSSDSQLSTSDAAKDAELMAEAKMLRQHKSKLETRMQVLEDHNKQLEAQLQRLRQLLEQPPADKTPQYDNSARVTPSLTPSSSYHGSPEFSRRTFGNGDMNGYDDRRAVDIQQVTSQIEHAFPSE